MHHSELVIVWNFASRISRNSCFLCGNKSGSKASPALPTQASWVIGCLHDPANVQHYGCWKFAGRLLYRVNTPLGAANVAVF